MQSAGPAPTLSIRPVFLTAEWRSLVMVNYAVDPAILNRHLPRGVELDLWQGEALVSMVGFRFLRTRVMGIAVPFHQDFDEVNLRFYVRKPVEGGGWQRGVVFVREIVPKHMIALVARVFYNEPYIGLPMRHRIPEMGAGGRFEYGWRFRGTWCGLGAETTGEPATLVAGGAEEFIFEHYWGYTRQRDGGTAEYQVEHAPWRVWQTSKAWLDGELSALYGAEFGDVLRQEPRSAFVADGSGVLVRRGIKLGGGEIRNFEF
jgi:uncharacterized protein YqjF (DUF2071 family)